MLRITRDQKVERIALVLEGKLIGPWLNAVRSEFESVSTLGSEVTLDLASVTYMDPNAVALIRDMIQKGARITAYSSFVRELLEVESNR